MKLLLSFIFLFGFARSDIASVVSFADANWNCTDSTCATRVISGTFQPSYQCSEFVSRSLAAGGYIDLGPNDPQSAYLSHTVNGKKYDMLWVSSVQGLPYGMEDYFIDMGWINVGSDCNTVKAGYAVICVGADGPHSHAIVGVGNKLADSHNSAALHTNPCYYNVNAIYAPPGTVPSGQTFAAPVGTSTPPAPAPTFPAGCSGVYTTNTASNLRDGASITANILLVMPSGSTVYDISGTTTAAGAYNWRHVQFNGTTGYCADTLLNRSGNCVVLTTAAPHAVTAPYAATSSLLQVSLFALLLASFM